MTLRRGGTHEALMCLIYKLKHLVNNLEALSHRMCTHRSRTVTLSHVL